MYNKKDNILKKVFKSIKKEEKIKIYKYFHEKMEILGKKCYGLTGPP